VLSTDSTIGEPDLPEPIIKAPQRERALSFAIGTPLEELERRAIHATLEHTGGDKRLAAQLLGIATRTIYRKLDAERDGVAIDNGAADEAGDRKLDAERDGVSSDDGGSDEPG
jgi:two-component system response regulator HydG